MSELVGLKSGGGETQEAGSSGISSTSSVQEVPAAPAPAAAATAATAVASCSLVAKWQGKTIELPALPASTTIGQVKVSVAGNFDVHPIFTVPL